MSEQFTHTDRDGDILAVSKNGIVVERSGDDGRASLSAYLPTDPAELHRLVEAILGRKVAAVIYDDELPELDSNLHRLHAHGRVTDSLAESERSEALLHLARARFYEARDAAAKEQKHAEEAEVKALAESLYLARYGSNATPLDQIICHDADGWRDAGRRAYELGARAPQGEEEAR